MFTTKYLVAGIATAGVLAAGVTGIASAATTSSTNSNVGTSGISKTTYHQDHLQSVAKVLGVSTDTVTAARKNKTFDQLLTNAHLTKAEFHQKLKAELTSELEAAGYSQSQVTIAMQHREIAHLRHDKK